jgi:hypothetical protein
MNMSLLTHNKPPGQATLYSSQELELLLAVAADKIKELELLAQRLAPGYRTYLATQQQLALWRGLAAKFDAK